MREDWEKLYVSMGEFQDLLEEILPEFPQSKHFISRKKALSRQWARLQKEANDFDTLVPDVVQIPVEVPFDDPGFSEQWQVWKDYLVEQHSLTMGTRMEVKSLKRLVEISGKNLKNAIKILDFAMATGYRNFFIPKENNSGQEASSSTTTIEY